MADFVNYLAEFSFHIRLDEVAYAINIPAGQILAVRASGLQIFLGIWDTKPLIRPYQTRRFMVLKVGQSLPDQYRNKIRENLGTVFLNNQTYYIFEVDNA